MADKASSIHTASKILTASKSDIVEWIVNANKFLHSQTDTVKKSFLVCGIANNLDGSEYGIVRVAAEIPLFGIPYSTSSSSDETESDPFQTSDDNSEEDSASEEFD